MKKDILKNAILESYGTIAKHRAGGMMSKLFACCDRTPRIKEISENIGYSTEQMNAVPENSNMGLGCGNPLGFTKIKKGITVLDLGSGAGFDCFIASPLVGDKGKVIGVDFTEEMISLANKNAKIASYKNVEFIKGDIENLPIVDNSIDLVISNCVINLSTDKAKVFKEAYRALKVNGELSISDIVLLGELPDFIKGSVEGHIACISGAEPLENYYKYAKSAGFSEITIEAKSTFPLELVLMDPLVQKIVKDFELSKAQINEIASLISSITMSAKKILR